MLRPTMPIPVAPHVPYSTHIPKAHVILSCSFRVYRTSDGPNNNIDNSATFFLHDNFDRLFHDGV